MRPKRGVLVYRFFIALILSGLAFSCAAADRTSLDIDTGGVTGNTTDLGNGSYTVEGAGSDLWDQSDHFRYVYAQISGDFDCRVLVSDLQVTNPWSKAGIQLRASTDANSVHASMLVSGQNGFAFQHRDNTGGWSSWAWGGWNSPPNSWVRLVRIGSLVTGYVSSDGATWYRVDSVTWNSADPVLLGLAVTSHDSATLCKAEFRNFSIQIPPGPVNGYSSIDINSAIDGSTTAAGGDGLDVVGSGSDLWNTQDSFRLAYQNFSGNFDLRSRVQALDVTDSWSKAGVTVRASTDPGSVHATMLVSGSNGYGFQHRDETNGWSSHTGGGGNALPNSWVRIIRNDNIVTATNPPMV